MAERVVVVTTAWGHGTSAYLVRRVAAALAMVAEVTVVLAEGHRGEVVKHGDGPFWVVQAPSRTPEPQRAGLLQAALTAGGAGGVGAAVGVPAPVRSELRRLAGSGTRVPQLLHDLAPDAVVVADHRHELSMALRQPAGAWRRSLLPLAVDDLALALSGQDGIWDGWDAVLATNAYEAALLRAALGATAGLVHDLGVAMEAPPAVAEVACSAPPGLAAWVGDDSWLVVLDDAAATSKLRVDIYLSLRLPTLTTVVVGLGQTAVVKGRSRRVTGPLNRSALWELTAGAVALVDPRPAQVFAKEVLESLMLCTPVIVPAGSGYARHAAETGNGGLWYRDAAELVACITRMRDPEVRDTLGAAGGRWCRLVHADLGGFVDATSRAVLGRSARSHRIERGA